MRKYGLSTKFATYFGSLVILVTNRHTTNHCIGNVLDDNGNDDDDNITTWQKFLDL
jgi:hydrogenase-4 membrane subunit HyfE